MGYLEKISQHRIAPPAVTGERDGRRPDRPAPSSSYNAGRLREVCQVFTRKMLEPDCTVGLTLSGALTPGRPGDELPDPPDPGRLRRLDRLDRGQPLPRHALRARPAAAPEPARTSTTSRCAQNDVIRIYDIVFDYKTLLDTDAFYRELIRDEAFARPMGTAEFHHEVGRYLHGRAADAGPAGAQPAGRGVRGGRADLHVEPRRQLDRHEPGGPEPARRQAPDRRAPRRQRDRGDRLRRQARAAASRAS